MQELKTTSRSMVHCCTVPTDSDLLHMLEKLFFHHAGLKLQKTKSEGNGLETKILSKERLKFRFLNPKFCTLGVLTTTQLINLGPSAAPQMTVYE